MPRSIDVMAESPVSVEQFHAAFSHQSYWLARLDAFGYTSLDSLTVDPDETVNVATTQDLRHEMLPGLIARFWPGELKIVRKETWTPIGDRRMRGKISAAARGAPGSCVATALLAPMGDGSRMDFSATVTVKVPVVGGQIESLLKGQLVNEVPAVERFTTTWISENA